MVSNDKNFLLYIEPKKEDKLETPINDELTSLMEMALSKAKVIARYRGWHTVDCGQRSDNRDYLLENGMQTNNLAPFYLRWYRYSIPESEMKKVEELRRFYSKS